MKTEQFLRHYGITSNPFSEEDAQTDAVFKRGCLWKIHHPAWDKFFGSPGDPSTALIFGEKGSGKTALRLQASAELAAYNEAHPTERVFVIEYDDFNPFLDHFRAATRARDATEALKRWRLQDHMDAILALGVTRLVDELTAERSDLTTLTLDRRRRCTTSRPASRSRGAGAGCGGGRGSARSGAAATSRSASARRSWSRSCYSPSRACGAGASRRGCCWWSWPCWSW